MKGGTGKNKKKELAWVRGAAKIPKYCLQKIMPVITYKYRINKQCTQF